MYVRPPSQTKQRVRVPENYSGHAFTGNGDYNDMPPPARQTPPRSDIPPRELISNEDNSLDTRHEHTLPATTEAPVALIHTSDEKQEDTDRKDNGNSSLLSHLLPPSGKSSHFPFGHGIGSEELLIMGAMLLVYLHGNECGEHDNDFLILLALLLFSG